MTKPNDTQPAVALRVQRLDPDDRVLIISELAAGRHPGARFSPGDVTALLENLALPGISKVSNNLRRLEARELVLRLRGRGRVWRVTPSGHERLQGLIDEMDVAALSALAHEHRMGAIAELPHPVVPPELAPPDLVRPVRDFLRAHPFDRNVFGMTRYPNDAADPRRAVDRLGEAIREADETCRRHGLEFHLASDRAIVDGLWTNVAAHMWACRYGIAFLEKRSSEGLNYNLTIETGASLMVGRRLALLKDGSVERMPTDLVGHIYKPVDLEAPLTVREALHRWIRDDLDLGACPRCPAT